MKNVWLLAPSLALFATPSLAQSATFSVEELAGPPGATNESVFGLNNTGEVVGVVSGGSACPTMCAVTWHDGTPTLLGSVEGARQYGPLSINNAGEVAGTAEIAATRLNQAVVWRGGVPTLLPAPDAQHPVTFASAINSAGEVSGGASQTGGTYVPVVWHGLTPITLDMPSGSVTGLASAANDSGLVVGSVCCTRANNEAVVWYGTTPILLPKSADAAGAQAVAINSSGLIVGHYSDGPTLIPAAWVDRTIVTLAPLMAGFSNSAVAVNDRGMIVGEATLEAQLTHAVLWNGVDAAPEDLNDLISANVAKAIVLTGALGINDNCAIAANGYVRATGAEKAFLLVPTDSSSCVDGSANARRGETK